MENNIEKRGVCNMLKNKPVAFCNACNEYSHDAAVINERHTRTKNGEKCEGLFRSALREDDWEKCPACNGTGNVMDKACHQCNSEGWIVVHRY